MTKQMTLPQIRHILRESHFYLLPKDDKGVELIVATANAIRALDYYIERIPEGLDEAIYEDGCCIPTSKDDLTLDSVVTKEEAIALYRTVTGACESGTRYFVEQNADKVKDSFKVKEIIALTKGQYGNDSLVNFIGKE